MNKTARKILIFFFIAALFAVAAVFACDISGKPKVAAAETDTGFTYLSIDVKAEVGEDKVLKICERLTLEFGEEGQTSFRRGIMKTFYSRPNKNGIFPVRSFNADLREPYATADGRTADVESTISPNGTYYFVYISAEEAFPADTPVEVEFYYVYDMSADITSGYGELLFPAFNDAYYWLKNGARYNLELTFPQGFSVDSVSSTLIDGEGEWTPAEGDYIAAEGNVFKASFAMKERVMFSLFLPDGLFAVPYHAEYWIFFGIAVALMVACGAVTYIYRGRTPVHSVEFTPPDVNPLFFSAYWHGYTRKRDVATLILQWANLGCVKLKRDGKRDIIIEKTAPLPENRLKEEREYFDALFSQGGVYSSKEVKRGGHFWHRRRISNAVYELMNRADEAVTYVPAAEKARGAVPVIGFLTVAVAAMYFALVSGEFGYVSLVGILAFIGAFEVYGLYLFKSILRMVRSVFILRVIVTAFLIGFAGPLIAVAAFTVYLYRPIFDYALLMIICAVWAVISFAVLPKFITRRTAAAQELYGKMLGFKRFISTAEVPRLERMIDECPEYYYDVLPYVMMMGLSRKADKKFAGVKGAAPDWADGFDLRHLSSSLFSSVSGAVRGVAVKRRDIKE